MSKKLVTFQIDEDTYAKFGAVISAQKIRKGDTISELITSYVKSNEGAVNELKVNQKRISSAPEIYGDLRKWTSHIASLGTTDMLSLENRIVALHEILVRIRNRRPDADKLRLQNPYEKSEDAIFAKPDRKNVTK